MEPETIRTILERMKSPLQFASQEDFVHLSLLRDVEMLMDRFLAQLGEALKISGTRREAGRLFGAWRSLFRGFDTLSVVEKKECIQKALVLHNEMISSLVNPGEEDTGQRQKALSEEDRKTTAYHLQRLSLPVQYIKGVGPRFAAFLDKKKLKTVGDLLYFLPYRYEDRRFVKSIAQTEVGCRETIVADLLHGEIKRYGSRRVYEATFQDDTGLLVAKWFHGQTAYLNRAFKQGKRYVLTGEIRLYGFQRNMLHPDYELLGEQEEDMVHFKRIVPLYSEVEGIPPKMVRRILLRVVEEYADAVMSPIPDHICRQRRLMNIHQAIRHVHFPPEGEDITLFNEKRADAYRRLIYDEFFFFQLAMAIKKKGTSLRPGIALHTGGALSQRFRKDIPFSLTKAQERVIAEIERDMKRASPMTRLIQGDVGSGKTVVAMAAMVAACDNGYQAAMMVPTELLAEQHFRTLSSWARTLGLDVALLSGGLGMAERKILADAIREGKIPLVVGTHALISQGTEFANLGLVVIDEQHRFGVLQKASIRSKGLNPHVLVMTATPIPRTLAMTVYGDLDVSVIDELPPGKKAIQTKIMYEHQRERVYEMIRKELKNNNQVFIVYPLVEESENLDLKDATHMAQHLGHDIFSDEVVGLVHGKMKRSEREEIMMSFAAGEIRILVATTVIEVGIDVPQASLMIIEHAERFGLSQLHQLRGRVGRSDIPSFCVLLAQKNMSPEAKRRLKIMVESQDGFRLAEEDLAIRGPGEFMGTRQSGLPDFRIAHIVRDMAILEEAKRDAFQLLEEDPELCRRENFPLMTILKERWQEKLDIAQTA